MIKIDKNIEMPTKHTTKFPFNEMEIGDSFLHPGNLKAAYQQAYGRSKGGLKFTVRMTTKGPRIWRVS